MKKLLVILLFFPLVLKAQTKEEAFKTFENLIGGKWSIDAAWGDGTPFKQEYEYSWGLNNTIINVKTTGIVNMETGERGQRNKGIIAWDTNESKMLWYQFDVYGGIYKVEVSFAEGNIYMEYDYTADGATYHMRDSMEPIDENTYTYSVAMKTEEGLKILLKGELKRDKK